MPYICFKLNFYNGSTLTPLPNHPQCGYISIDGGPFKKLYYGAVFEVSEGIHCISTANRSDLDTVALAHAINNKLKVNTCSCTPASRAKEDYAGQDKLLSLKDEVHMLSASIIAQYGRNEPFWEIRRWSSTTPNDTDKLSEFFGERITDGRSFLSQRATYLGGPIDWAKVNAKPAQTPTPKVPPAYTPPVVKPQSTYDPARELRRKRRKRKKLLKKIAIGIACAAVASLILWWLIAILEPWFSQSFEAAKDMK